MLFHLIKKKELVFIFIFFRITKCIDVRNFDVLWNMAIYMHLKPGLESVPVCKLQLLYHSFF